MRFSLQRGLFFVTAPAWVTWLLCVLGLDVRPMYQIFGAAGWGAPAALAISALQLMSAWGLGSRRDTLARVGLTISWGAAAALSLPIIITEPIGAFLSGILAIGLISWVWRLHVPEPIHQTEFREDPLEEIAGAGLGTAAMLLMAVMSHRTDWAADLAFIGPMLAATSLLGGRSIAHMSGARRVFGVLLCGGAMGATFVTPWVAAQGFVRFGAFLLFFVAAIFFWRSCEVSSGDYETPLLDIFSDDPIAGLVVAFLFLGILGGLALSLPQAQATPAPHTLIDSIFTSFSAVCVTGLIVLDTPHDFTFMGQAVILALIQLGGLGIMAFATGGYALLGARMSVEQEGAAAATFGESDRSDIFTGLSTVFGVALSAEALGACILGWRFWWSHGDAPAEAAWRGLFTAVSAFCNAGFALQTDSLIPYQHDPVVLVCVSMLIILGGIGPAVIVILPAILRRRERASLQVKVIAVATAVLLALPFAIFFASSPHPDLHAMGWGDRAANALMHAATLRTAGFESLDLNQLGPSFATGMMVWMFIGGAPSSTAGGVKVTSVSVLIAYVIGALRGHARAYAMGWRIARRSVEWAAVVIVLGGMSVLALTLVLQASQTGVTPHQLAFEAVSALGTVGLSLGATGALNDFGKFCVICGMFLGRVAPLAIFLFLSRRSFTVDRGFPEQTVASG